MARERHRRLDSSPLTCLQHNKYLLQQIVWISFIAVGSKWGIELTEYSQPALQLCSLLSVDVKMGPTWSVLAQIGFGFRCQNIPKHQAPAGHSNLNSACKNMASLDSSGNLMRVEDFMSGHSGIPDLSTMPVPNRSSTDGAEQIWSFPRATSWNQKRSAAPAHLVSRFGSY